MSDETCFHYDKPTKIAIGLMVFHVTEEVLDPNLQYNNGAETLPQSASSFSLFLPCSPSHVAYPLQYYKRRASGMCC